MPFAISPRLAPFFCLWLCLTATAAEPKYTLQGELNASALSGLVEAWDMDEFQKTAGLPANLRFASVQDYLTDESRLRELPDSLLKELGTVPLPAEISRGQWHALVNRWKALPLAQKLPALKLSHFDPIDQARAIVWSVSHGAPIPPVRKAAPKELRDLLSQFELSSGDRVLSFRLTKETEDLDKAQNTAEALLQATRDEADLHWTIRAPDRDLTFLQNRFRFMVRVQTADDSVQIVNKESISLFWADTEVFDAWMELVKAPEAGAIQSLSDALKKALEPSSVEEWTAYVDDKQTSLATLMETMESFAPWPARVPESRDLVTAIAKRVQYRLRPFRVLQMGPDTDVLTMLKAIQLSASLLPPEDRKITLAHGAFPLAVEYQMHPSPEVLAEALALLSTENPQARKASLTRLRSSDAEVVLPLVAELSHTIWPDPELSMALDEARTKWNWAPPERMAASLPPPISLPYSPGLCEIELNSVLPDLD